MFVFSSIHSDVEKCKLEKYIEGFNYVYQYYDKSIAHETNFGRLLHAEFDLSELASLPLLHPLQIIRIDSCCCFLLLVEPVKLILDCQMVNEDTLIGLELQQLTPFRFHFRKLWINHYFRQILSPHTTSDINLVLNLTNVDVRIHL